MDMHSLQSKLTLPSLPQAPKGVSFPGSALDMPPVTGTLNENAPLIAGFTPGAENDETIVVSGSSFGAGELTAIAWGNGFNHSEGEFYELEVLTHSDIAATITASPLLSDGVLCLWLVNENGCSNAVWINRPSLWWCNPAKAHPGDVIGLYGRELTHFPDNQTTAAFLETEEETIRLELVSLDKYVLEVKLPESLCSCQGKIYVHHGYGGVYGWSDSVSIQVECAPAAPKVIDLPKANNEDYSDILYAAIKENASDDQSIELRLPAGYFLIKRQLILPGNVFLTGAGAGATHLEFDLSGEKPRRFIQATYGHHIICKEEEATLTYAASIPQDGEYEVWARYTASCENHQEATIFKDSSRLKVSIGTAETEENIYATGFHRHPITSYARWSRLGTIKLEKGEATVTLQKKGALTVQMDALAFTLNPMKTPTETTFPLPGNSNDTFVVQANDYITAQGCGYVTGDFGAPAVWITGSHGGLKHLTVSGDHNVHLGVAIGLPWDYPYDDHSTEDVTLDDVRILNVNGKDYKMLDGTIREINHSGVFIRNGAYIRVTNCEIYAQVPLYLRGLKQGYLCDNQLYAKRGGHGGALGAILSRRQPLNETVIARNLVASPKLAGSPTCFRIVWFSTGQGSVSDNYIGYNKGQSRYGGIPGYDQNVGEAILFETGNGCAYYGKPQACTSNTVQIAPERLVWHVTDEQCDGPETIPTQHQVVVLKGKGLGQTRQVVDYDREKGILVLDRPFTTVPDAESLVLVSPLFYRNTVHHNELADTMSGIQFWINGVENIVAENKLSSIRRQGIYMFACFSRDAENQEPLFNSGVGVEYFNLVTENDISNCNSGIMVTGNSNPNVYAGWPICLGNVVRSNTTRSMRTAGIRMSGFESSAVAEKADVANVAEYNYIIDSTIAGVEIKGCNDGAVVRRNHMFSWHTNDAKYQVVSKSDDAVNTHLKDNNFEIGG